MAISRSADALDGSTAIVGIGWTPFTKASGVTVADLAALAALNAISDAGLSVGDIDGVLTYFWGPELSAGVSPASLVRMLGIPCCRYHIFNAGGGSSVCAVVATAAAAVNAGLCNYAVVYYAANGRSGRTIVPPRGEPSEDWGYVYGQVHAASMFGPRVVAHMNRYGIDTIDFAHLAIAQRDNAVLNKKAMMRTPITVQDHQASPWVVEPFRLLDCCLETDGAVALVITSKERATDLRQAPVYIMSATGGVTSRDGPLWQTYAETAADIIYGAAGISVADVDFAELYDPFTGMCMLHIEGFGLCGVGESGGWVAGGGNALDGETPVNTHGGMLSEAYMRGLNHVIEAVQQLRPGGVVDDFCDGTHDFDRSRCRQLRDPKIGLVCGEGGESALLLRKQ